MIISQEIRAAGAAVTLNASADPTAASARVGMWEKAEEFRERGGEIYVPAAPEA